VIGKSIIGTFVPATDSSGKDLEAMIRDIPKHPENYIANLNENIKKKGERMQVLWSNYPVMDSKGNVVKIIAIGNVMKGYI
jgi:hypothetical protein